MKTLKILFVVILSLFVVSTFAQTNIQPFANVTVQNKTFVQEIPQNAAWSFQLVWTGFNNTNAICKIEVSNNGTSWQLYSDNMTDTLGTAAGNTIFADDNFSFRYMRINFAKGSVTTGTINGYLHIKEQK